MIKDIQYTSMSVRSNLNWSMTVVTITIRHTKKSAMPQGPCVATHGISPSIILILSYWKKFCAIYGYYWNREDDGDVIKDPLILRMISMCVGDHDRLSTIPFCRVWVNLLTMGGWGFGPAVITSLFVFFWRYIIRWTTHDRLRTPLFSIQFNCVESLNIHIPIYYS